MDVVELVKMARHVAGRVGGDEDVVQECVVKGLECAGESLSYVYKAMLNRALNVVMRDKLRDWAPLSGNEAGDGSPDLAISRKMFVGATKVARAHMPDALRSTVNVLLDVGMDVRRVASVLGVGVMTVHKRIERVRKWWNDNKEFCEMKGGKYL